MIAEDKPRSVDLRYWADEYLPGKFRIMVEERPEVKGAGTWVHSHLWPDYTGFKDYAGAWREAIRLNRLIALGVFA